VSLLSVSTQVPVGDERLGTSAVGAGTGADRDAEIEQFQRLGSKKAGEAHGVSYRELWQAGQLRF
jgi:hypothetical protein